MRFHLGKQNGKRVTTVGPYSIVQPITAAQGTIYKTLAKPTGAQVAIAWNCEHPLELSRRDSPRSSFSEQRQTEQVNPLSSAQLAGRSLRPWVNRCLPAAEQPMLRQANVLAVAFQRRHRRLNPHGNNGSLVAQGQGPRLGHGQRESEVPVMELADRSSGRPPRSAALPAEPTFVATSLLVAMWASLTGSWRQARPPQRFAAVVGAALMVVGVAHLAIWLVVGGGWAGPVSFRKPTTFGVSFGLTTVTLAWVTGHLRVSDRARWWLLGPLAAADTYEVVWVAFQRWRGVASHFNFATPLDTGLFLLGGVAIAVTVTVILALAVLAFTAMQAPPSMALAIRAGLLILLVAQGVGGWMIQHGVGPAGDGATTGLTTFGPAGIMKVPHAVAIHAIQVLPAQAWLLSFATLAERRRTRLVATATLGYVALVAVSLLQTATGLAPWDVGALAVVLYLVGIGLLGVPLVAALLALRHPAPRG